MRADVAFEIVKLMVQVAWADGDIADGEIEQILGLAEHVDVGPTNLAMLATLLRGEEPLPPPDIGLLRQHRSTALSAAEAVARADSFVAPDEKALLEELRSLLGA